MNIIIIDDEQNIRKITSMALESMGHKVFTAHNGRKALEQLENEKIEVAFLDLRLGNENGLDLINPILERSPNCAIIVFTAHSSIESAVEAMRNGAFDYIPKPFAPEQIRQLLKKVKDRKSLETKVTNLESQVASDSPKVDLGSNEPHVRKQLEVAFKAAETDSTMMILGPSGTGKTVLAREVHKRSPRKDAAFVTVHCPTLSRELLESDLFGHVKGSFTGAVRDTWGKVSQADGGTLFLDEVGELPLEIQPKLLRLLQEREYERLGETKTRTANIRLITATNKDLKDEVEKGNFREDLYYRLNIISLNMPALKERPGDIMNLVNNSVEFYGRKFNKPDVRVSQEVENAFLNYEWPGNLRELGNIIERAFILCNGETIELSDLPESFHGQTQPNVMLGQMVSLEELESEHIRRIISNTESLEEAATVLGIDTTTLYRKRKRLGMLK